MELLDQIHRIEEESVPCHDVKPPKALRKPLNRKQISRTPFGQKLEPRLTSVVKKKRLSSRPKDKKRTSLTTSSSLPPDQQQLEVSDCFV